MLEVPTTDNPPALVDIWPLDVTWVQYIAAVVRKPPLNTELPTAVRTPQFNVPAIVAFPEETFNPLDEVRPAEVKVPAMVALPEETVKPLDEVRPAEVNVPAIVAFTELTIKPLDEVAPLQTRAFVDRT